ncbi:hypothetical protein HK096_009689, partial [Nowakowskiella sp. JEL0078]
MADIGDLQKLIAGLTSGFESVRQGLKDDSDDDDDDVALSPAKSAAPNVVSSTATPNVVVSTAPNVVASTAAETPRQPATSISPASQTPTAASYSSPLSGNNDIAATFVGKSTTPQRIYSDIPAAADTFVGGRKPVEQSQPQPDYAATFIGNKSSPLNKPYNDIVPSFLPSIQRSKQSATDQVQESFMPQYQPPYQAPQLSAGGIPASFVPGHRPIPNTASPTSIPASFIPGYQASSTSASVPQPLTQGYQPASAANIAPSFVPGQRQQQAPHGYQMSQSNQPASAANIVPSFVPGQRQQAQQQVPHGYQMSQSNQPLPQDIESSVQAYNAIPTSPPNYTQNPQSTQVPIPQYQKSPTQSYQNMTSSLSTPQPQAIPPPQPAPSGIGLDAKRLQALKQQNALRNENVKAKRQAIDIAFLMDITGTMVPWLDLAKNKIDQIISRIEQKFPDAQTRVAFVGYSDWDNRRPPRQHNVV